MADPKQQAEDFAKELRALVQKHYGSLKPDEVAPIGAELSQILPTLNAATTAGVTTTTTVTLYPSLDTDSPDSD